MTEKLQTLRDSALFRWIALLLLALAMFCSYIFMDILSPIQALMQSERGWDPTAFGTMQTTINTKAGLLGTDLDGIKKNVEPPLQHGVENISKMP